MTKLKKEKRDIFLVHLTIVSKIKFRFSVVVLIISRLPVKYTSLGNFGTFQQFTVIDLLAKLIELIGKKKKTM